MNKQQCLMAKWKTVVFFDFNETFTHTHHTQMNTNAWPSHAFDERDKRMTNTHDDHKCMTRWTTNACCMKGFAHCVLWRLINRLVVKPGSHFDHCFGGMWLRLEKWYNSMTFWSNVTLYDNCKSVWAAFGTVISRVHTFVFFYCFFFFWERQGNGGNGRGMDWWVYRDQK